MRINDFISESERDALFQPTAQASGLPARIYTDENFWALERKRLFSPTWFGVAFESDLPDPEMRYRSALPDGKLFSCVTKMAKSMGFTISADTGP